MKTKTFFKCNFFHSSSTTIIFSMQTKGKKRKKKMLWTILFCIQFKSLSFSFAYKVVSWDDEHYTYQVISESRGKCLFIFFLKKHVSEKHLPGTQLRSVKKTRLKTTRMRFDDERNGWLLVERCFIHYSCGPSEKVEFSGITSTLL